MTHDVARLTRRHVWIISALALIGRFPKRTRFHGRGLGWNRHDVHDWMARRRRCTSTRDLPRNGATFRAVSVQRKLVRAGASGKRLKMAGREGLLAAAPLIPR